MPIGERYETYLWLSRLYSAMPSVALKQLLAIMEVEIEIELNS